MTLQSKTSTAENGRNPTPPSKSRDKLPNYLASAGFLPAIQQSADPGRRAQSSSSYVESNICHKIQNPKSKIPKLQNPKSKIPKIQNPKSPKSKIQNPQNPPNPKSKIPQIWGVGGLT